MILMSFRRTNHIEIITRKPYRKQTKSSNKYHYNYYYFYELLLTGMNVVEKMKRHVVQRYWMQCQHPVAEVKQMTSVNYDLAASF